MSVTRQTKHGEQTNPADLFPLQPLVNTHVHIIPPKVWHDFLAIDWARAESVSILQQYQIDTVIIDRRRHGRLEKLLQKSAQYKLFYSNSEGQIWRSTTSD